MTLLKRALSLTLLATSIYAAPYVNLTYVPGENGYLQSACIVRKFRQLLLAPYYRMKLGSACPGFAPSACWCRALHWQSRESNSQVPDSMLRC